MYPPICYSNRYDDLFSDLLDLLFCKLFTLLQQCYDLVELSVFPKIDGFLGV